MLKYNLSQLDSLSKKVLSNLYKTDCIFLFGELGSGKTTFARSLIHQLQKKNKVRKTEVLSPTFNLLHEYKIKSLKVLHYDLYRLKKLSDIKQLGIFETSEKHIKIIEWPELIKPKPKNRIEIFLKYLKQINARKVKINGFGKWKNYEFFKI